MKPPIEFLIYAVTIFFASITHVTLSWVKNDDNGKDVDSKRYLAQFIIALFTGFLAGIMGHYILGITEMVGIILLTSVGSVLGMQGLQMMVERVIDSVFRPKK